MGFSSTRHIPVYLATDLAVPVAACAMIVVRSLIGRHGAKLQSVNGRSGLIIDRAEILQQYVGRHLHLLLSEAVQGHEEGPPVAPIEPAPSHQPMNDREVMEHLVRASRLTGGAQAHLDEQTIAEIREIRMRLSDAIPGMTYPRPTSGPVAARLNEMLQLFTQAQAGKNLDDIAVIRKIQALTW